MPDEHGLSPTGGQQRLINESWPASPRTIGNAPHPIPVTARLVWEEDGQQWVQTRALRWNRRHVFVALHDRRVGAVIGVWLDPADVRRR